MVKSNQIFFHVRELCPGGIMSCGYIVLRRLGPEGIISEGIVLDSKLVICIKSQLAIDVLPEYFR